MLDVVTFGESMILLAATRPGRLRDADHFARYVAGAESNTAIGLARLGHRAGWVSRVGADEFGACVRAAIRGEGVDVSAVVEDAEAPTGVFFKERRRAGQTQVTYYRASSAASRLTPDDLAPNYLAQARYLHLTGITPALSASCRQATRHALDIAEEAGVPVSFDPNVRLKLWPEEEARRVLGAMLPRMRVVLAGKDEAALLTGEADPEAAARAIAALGPSQVVVKLGAQGALAFEDGCLVHEPAVEVDAHETVGAGDAFNAGFLSGQLRGWDLERSLRLGNLLGARATGTPGDVEGLPTWPEIQHHFDQEVPPGG